MSASVKRLLRKVNCEWNDPKLHVGQCGERPNGRTKLELSCHCTWGVLGDFLKLIIGAVYCRLLPFTAVYCRRKRGLVDYWISWIVEEGSPELPNCNLA